MIIELEDHSENDVSIDTDTASREELVKALVMLNRYWTHCGKLIDAQDRVLADCGLRLDDAADRPLTIVDIEKATAWFGRALAEFVEDHLAASAEIEPTIEAALARVARELAAVAEALAKIEDVLQLIVSATPAK